MVSYSADQLLLNKKEFISVMFTCTNQHMRHEQDFRAGTTRLFSITKFHTDSASNMPDRALKNLLFQDFIGVHDTFRFSRLQYVPRYFNSCRKAILPKTNLLALSGEYFSS